jgi:2-iminoacetate synthase
MATYNPKSSHAEEFICDEEIRESLDYASRNKSNRSLIEGILNKAASLHGLSHKEAAVLLDCDIPEMNQRLFSLAREI